MRILRAPWVFPIQQEPIADGAVALRGSRVLTAGPAGEVLNRYPDAVIENHPGRGILPGLVNAHVHLALADLPALPRGEGLIPWLQALLPELRSRNPEDFDRGTSVSLDRAFTAGTALAGEIMTGTRGLSALQQDPRIQVRVFFEFLGVSAEACRERAAQAVAQAGALSRYPHLGGGLSPHAPYTTHHDTWREVVAANPDLPWSSHVSESLEELEFMNTASGPMADFLSSVGGTATEGVTGVPSAVRWMDQHGLLTGSCLLVHGTHLRGPEAQLLARRGASLCLCPGSNRWLGVGEPRVGDLLNSGLRLCLGSDSWSSNDDLSIFKTMREIRALAPELTAREVLKMATRNGAEALGYSGRFGVIAEGADARLISVPVEADTAEAAEEQLLIADAEASLGHLGEWGGVC